MIFGPLYITLWYKGTLAMKDKIMKDLATNRFMTNFMLAFSGVVLVLVSYLVSFPAFVGLRFEPVLCVFRVNPLAVTWREGLSLW